MSVTDICPSVCELEWFSHIYVHKLQEFIDTWNTMSPYLSSTHFLKQKKVQWPSVAEFLFVICTKELELD